MRGFCFCIRLLQCCIMTVIMRGFSFSGDVLTKPYLLLVCRRSPLPDVAPPYSNLLHINSITYLPYVFFSLLDLLHLHSSSLNAVVIEDIFIFPSGCAIATAWQSLC
jgi:hypothetical protein